MPYVVYSGQPSHNTDHEYQNQMSVEHLTWGSEVGFGRMSEFRATEVAYDLSDGVLRLVIRLYLDPRLRATSVVDSLLMVFYITFRGPRASCSRQMVEDQR